MDGPAWITTQELAHCAGIGRQTAHEVLSTTRRLEDFTWHGARLVVRSVHGRGGRSGQRYEVWTDSLPLAIKLRISATKTSVEGAFNPPSKAATAASWWAEFLHPALAHPRYSRERGEAMRALAGQRVCGPDGEWFTPSLRDIERKTSKATAGGIKALYRKRRETKPESRLILSRRWDAETAGLDAELRIAIAESTKRRIRGLWGKGTSYRDVRRLASEHCALMTAKAGIGTYEDLLPACQLPKHVVEAGRDARRVYEFRTNVKEWDNARPRVQLTSAGLRPMELVYGDVHHFDVYVRRDDGSLATPKGVAWLDAATRRLRIDLVLCEPGTAIRNADLIKSFVTMTQDPHWGMPGRLYLDNGSEYAFADFVRDAINLAGLDCRSGQGGPVTRAAAYNAAAKGIIEGSFRVLEQTVLAPVKGYIGGDRMKTRSGNLGRAPELFDGSFHEFCAQFEGLLAYYNSCAQSGELAGRSPASTYLRAVDAGWQRTDVDADALLMAFSIEAGRKVVDGKISVGGELYYCDELIPHTGKRVRVQLPKFLLWAAVPVLTMQGELIGIVRPDPVFARLDPNGAREAARRKGLALADIAAEARELEDIDVPAEMAASAARQPVPPVPPSKGRIGLSVERGEIGRKVMQSPAETQRSAHLENQRALMAAAERAKMFRSTP